MDPGARRSSYPDHDPGLGVLAEGSPGRAALLADEGGVAIAALVDGVLQASSAPSIVRAWELADKLARSDTGYSTFMDMLRNRLGTAIRAAARENGQGRADRLLSRRPPRRVGRSVARARPPPR